MKTELQKRLATVTSSISIVTLWEHDPDCGPVSKECDGFAPEEDDGWQAWQSEICATAILESEEIEGSAYLGGTFEKAGDNPAESNPEISGYENQMTQEALEELRDRCTGGTAQAGVILLEIEAALAMLKRESAESYAAQRAEIEASRNPATV
jgi:hypothetical protein